jgi:hypothetical protein
VGNAVVRQEVFECTPGKLAAVVRTENLQPLSALTLRASDEVHESTKRVGLVLEEIRRAASAGIIDKVQDILGAVPPIDPHGALKVAVYDAKELICSVAGTGKGEARYLAGGTGVADTARQGELLGSADNGVGERCSAVTTGMAETTMPESVNVRL